MKKICGIIFVALLFFPGRVYGRTMPVPDTPGCDAETRMILPTQEDTSAIIYMRIYRDSVKVDSIFRKVEARVVEGKIISLFVGDREVPEDQYALYAGPLAEILREEQDLRAELFKVANEIAMKKRELDSLEKAPVIVSGFEFSPGEDIHEQIFAIINETEEGQITATDSLREDHVLFADSMIHVLTDGVLTIMAGRDEEAGMIREEISMLRQNETEIKDRLEKMEEAFVKEKINIPDEKKQKRNSEKRRRKRGKRKRS